MDEMRGQLHGGFRVEEGDVAAVSDFAMNKFHYGLTFNQRNYLMTHVESVLALSLSGSPVS